MQADTQLIVLAAPLHGVDKIYDRFYDQIIKFQADFSKIIANAGDRVLVLADHRAEKRLLQHGVPLEHILLKPMEDIWMRDFTVVEPNNPSQFLYTPQAQDGKARWARKVQSAFNTLADKVGLEFRKIPLYLDGGNWVSDGTGKVVVTERFLKDNRMDHHAGVQAIRHHTGATQVCILPDDDPDGLGHVDGMVMFLDSSTVCVNSYPEPLYSQVRHALASAFPGVAIVDLPVEFDDAPIDPRYSSASGIYVNATVTSRAVYLPQYGLQSDATAMSLVGRCSRRPVVAVPAEAVCKLGGACRCLTLQLTGANAEALLSYAAYKRR
mmetsp:Transcript_32138/g.73544  ORF Transcript_32138/g.73544 Transcript_32138/m.73544 type:complete len:324 (-) Transcript_32138:344-1315(-)